MGHSAGGLAGVYHCHGQGTNQAFMYSVLNEIRTTDELCLDAWGQDLPIDVHLEKCHGAQGNQAWVYDDATSTMRHKRKLHVLCAHT
jgi:polypeptide N-acetylgalactosaminyltransferase